MKKILSLFLLLCAVVLWNSCVQSVYSAPYVISSPECVIGKTDSFFSYAGVIASFINTAESDIASLYISFNVYDASTKKNPFFGSNTIQTVYEDIIYPDEETELCISLDEYVHSIPLEPFLIQNFCISKIVYSDGSVWTDYFCVFGSDR